MRDTMYGDGDEVEIKEMDRAEIQKTYRIYRIDHNGGGYSDEEWFRMSMSKFRNQVPDPYDMDKWDPVQIVPRKDYKNFYCGNNGTQAFRHKETGITIPDKCRQNGTCPDTWSSPTRKRQLTIHPDSPVLKGYIIHDEW